MTKNLLIILGALSLFIALGGISRSNLGKQMSDHQLLVDDADAFFRELSAMVYDTEEYAPALLKINQPLKIKSGEFIKIDELIIPDLKSIRAYQQRKFPQHYRRFTDNYQQQRSLQTVLFSVSGAIALLLGINHFLLPLVVIVISLLLIFKIFQLIKWKFHYNKKQITSAAGSNDDRILIEFDIYRAEERTSKMK